MATYNGTEGNDTLTGGSGNDTINGRTGNDTIQGLSGADSIDAGSGDDTVEGGEGNDTVAGGGGYDSVLGGAGNDVIWVGGYNDATVDTISGYFDGGEGDDYIRSVKDGYDASILGGTGNDRIEIGWGNTFLNPGGASFIDGGDGDDAVRVYILSSFAGTILGGAGYDTLETIMPSNSQGTYEGFKNVSGFEEINFSNGFLSSGPFGETSRVKIFDQNVGAGGLLLNLTAYYSPNGGPTAIVDASEVAHDSVHFRSLNKNNVTIAADDTFIGGQRGDMFESAEGDDVLDGRDGNDTFFAGSGQDTIFGGAGDDLIDGGNELDTAVYSGNFADYEITEVLYNTFTIRDLRGIDGTDTIIDVNKLSFLDGVRDVVIQGVEIIGDDTAEEFTGGGFADHLDGAGGNDTLVGAGGHDKLEGGAGGDTINGGDGNDQVEGDDGNDTLTGGAGNDTLTGGTGDDTYMLGDDTDTIVEGAGAAAKGAAASGGDTIVSSISRSLGDFANIENLRLTGAARDGTGNSGANLLTGNGVANLLTGGAGKDTLKGGGGGDSLVGGAGKDVLEGAAGKDKFVFLGLGDLGKKENKRDVIDDFKHGQKDKIDLWALDANSKSAKNDAFKLLAAEGAKFTKHAGQLRWDEQGTGKDKITVIEGDVNGDGKADFQIELTGWVHLVKGDFVL